MFLTREAGICYLAYQVKDPERFGVVAFDDNKKVLSIEDLLLQQKAPYTKLATF